jgi:hypothetical protein
VPDPIDSIFAPVPEGAPAGLTIPELRVLLQRLANLIVAVGTGQARIQDVSNEYTRLDKQLNANFKRLGLSNPFPWREMWDWYGFYSQELGTYRERREHVAGLTKAALGSLNETENTGVVHDPTPGDDDPTWERVNARVAGLIAKYSSAQTLDDWQDVGRRSREILVDLGKLLAQPGLVTAATKAPKLADAKAWFDLMLAQRAAGSSKAELRAVMRATWELAQKVTHGDVDDVDAFAAAQATVLVVRTTQKLLAIEPLPDTD